MDPRTQEALDYLDGQQIPSGTGASFTEREVLRAVADQTTTNGGGVLGHAYRVKLLQGPWMPQDAANVYALTHEIFFGTNFGRVVVQGLDVQGYGAVIDALLPIQVTNTDLLGELLLCAKYIGYSSSITADHAAIFDEAWAALDRGDFANNYHPILVGGLLYAAQ